MKKWIVKLVVTLVVIAAVVNIVHDFFANDTIHYFASQPQRWFLVAVIAVVGGLAVMLFDGLSPRLKRYTELIALGSIGAVLVCLAGCFVFMFVSLPFHQVYSEMRHMIMAVIACMTGAIAAVGFVFHKVFKRAVE